MYIGLPPSLSVNTYVPLFMSEHISLGGSYTVIEQSLSGRTTWAWAPRAFTDASGHIRLRSALVRFYYPLWRLDNLCWHDDGTGTSGPQHKAIRATQPDRANRRQLQAFREVSGEACVTGLTAAVAHPGRWPVSA